MFEPEQIKGYEQALTGWIRRAGRDDPEAFAQMVTLIETAKAQLVIAADELRSERQHTDGTWHRGFSWTDLGAALGVTRAAAQKRFGVK